MKVNVVVIPLEHGNIKFNDLMSGCDIPVYSQKELEELQNFIRAGIEAYEDWRVSYVKDFC